MPIGIIFGFDQRISSSHFLQYDMKLVGTWLRDRSLNAA
jgi:hypothetical protein